MSEWWTYRPSDLLMFSPRIYWRLFEAMNAAWWPLQPALAALALGALALLWRAGGAQAARAGRVALALLAACWLLAGWTFLADRLAPVFWVATGYATAFAAQALGLLALALAGGRLSLLALAHSHRAQAGAALVLWAVVGHPLLAPLAGRPVLQAEAFGLAPDPTAIATLGALLLLAPRAAVWPRLLWIIPVAWCALSAATLATMGEAQALVMLVAPGAALAAARLR
jgi:hypothetical protein